MLDIEVVKSGLVITACIGIPLWMIYDYNKNKDKKRKPVIEVKTGATRYTKVRNTQGRREVYDNQMNRWVYLDLLSEEERGFDESVISLVFGSDSLMESQSNTYSADSIVGSISPSDASSYDSSSNTSYSSPSYGGDSSSGGSSGSSSWGGGGSSSGSSSSYSSSDSGSSSSFD